MRVVCVCGGCIYAPLWMWMCVHFPRRAVGKAAILKNWSWFKKTDRGSAALDSTRHEHMIHDGDRSNKTLDL
jgi:hypothetical protein